MERDDIRRLANTSIENGRPVQWFEELYALAQRDTDVVPWADLEPNPHLMSWLATDHGVNLTGRALTIGCGLGDDAEELQLRGLQTTAFDVAESAVAWCKERFPDTAVEYTVADLFAPPDSWSQAFDFVFECYTVQSLPLTVRARAIAALSTFVRPGGHLLLVSRGRDTTDDPGQLPWPLTQDDLQPLQREFETLTFDDFLDDEDPPVRRFRVLLRRSDER
ncbi:MAG: class I SAM-dependent methyltransferase [Planctomycetota bacterium]